MLPALFALVGVGLLVAAGFGVEHPRFRPQWLGLACLALAVCWPLLAILGR